MESDNLYSPPSPKVDDISEKSGAITRPEQVVLSVQLAAANYVLGWISLAFSWDYFTASQSIGSFIWNQAFGLVLLVWIYYKIYVGRNWARITLLVILTLGLAMTLTRPAADFLTAAPPIAKAQMGIGLLLNLAILWLLFASPGRYWFKGKAGAQRNR